MNSRIAIALLPLCVSLGCSDTSVVSTEGEPVPTPAFSSDIDANSGGRDEATIVLNTNPIVSSSTESDETQDNSNASSVATIGNSEDADAIEIDTSVDVIQPIVSNDSAPDETSPVEQTNAVVNNDWQAPEGCIGDVDANGTQYCVYPDTRLFAATTSDGNTWWSFVLPGDNATNEIEAVFVFGDKVGLLADNMPDITELGEASVKINPYEVSLFEQGGEFISTVALQMDLNEDLFSDQIVGHQASDEPVQIVVTRGDSAPNLLINWLRLSAPIETLWPDDHSVLSRYDLDTGLAVAQYELIGEVGKLRADPFFMDDVILETEFETVRLNGTSLTPSSNAVNSGPVDAPIYTRITDTVFELTWPTEFFDQTTEGAVTYQVATYSGFYSFLAKETTNNHALISLDDYALPNFPDASFQSIQVMQFIDGEFDGSALYLPGPSVSRMSPGCEPVCDLFKDAPAENLTVNSNGRGQTTLNWSWNNNTDIEHTVIYRDGNLIGTSESTSFTDSLASPYETEVYAVVGVTSSGAETLPISIVKNAATEVALRFTPTSELITSEFVETLANHATGRSIFSLIANDFNCNDDENRFRVNQDSFPRFSTDYFFDCRSDSGVKSGVSHFEQPIPWAGNLFVWHSDDHGNTDSRIRDSATNELTIFDGEQSYGRGGGGQTDQACVSSWEQIQTVRNTYNVNSMAVFGVSHDWALTNATGSVYRDARSIRVLSDTGEVLRCVQSYSRGAQSSFTLSDTLFGVDLSVESSILFYDENPPSDALEEHYTITATRNNGEVIEINYPAIGADTASVTYPQNGRTVTIEVPTASAPFDL